jgi:hypothetical protein
MNWIPLTISAVIVSTLFGTVGGYFAGTGGIQRAAQAQETLNRLTEAENTPICPEFTKALDEDT